MVFRIRITARSAIIGMCHRIISRSRITGISMPFSRYKIEIICNSAFGAGIHIISGIQTICSYSILIYPIMSISCKSDGLSRSANRTFINFHSVILTIRGSITINLPVMPGRRPDRGKSGGTAFIVADISIRTVSVTGGPYGMIQVPDPVMSRGRNNT